MMCRLLLMVGMVSLAACADRTHMREGYGESNRRIMAQQVVNPDAGGRGPSQGLDPQEATIVARNYQRSLSPKDQSTTADPIFFVSPKDQKVGGDYMPPPSVPNERR